MAAILVDTLKPNLVQTLEGRPALVHCGPFANIAHGNNSLVADAIGLKVADFVVTESGFGADMGFEKLVDIVCRSAGFAPSAVVVVATTQALKHHGGDPNGGLPALERGAANLAANLRIVGELGFEAVVAVNRFPDDSSSEMDAVCRLALEQGAFAAEVNDGFERGGEGATALAEAVKAAAATPGRLRLTYDDSDPLVRKLEAVATKVYGADGVELSPAATRQAGQLDAAGLGTLPVCMAKTHLSLSHDPTADRRSERIHAADPRAACRTREQAGSSPSAATCRPCPACRGTRRRSGSTSTWRPAKSPACAEFPHLRLDRAADGRDRRRDRGSQLLAEVESLSLDSEEDDPSRKPAERAGDSDRLTQAEVMRRAAAEALRRVRLARVEAEDRSRRST